MIHNICYIYIYIIKLEVVNMHDISSDESGLSCQGRKSKKEREARGEKVGGKEWGKTQDRTLRICGVKHSQKRGRKTKETES